METLHGITAETEMCFTMAAQAAQNTAFTEQHHSWFVY